MKNIIKIHTVIPMRLKYSVHFKVHCNEYTAEQWLMEYKTNPFICKEYGKFCKIYSDWCICLIKTHWTETLNLFFSSQILPDGCLLQVLLSLFLISNIHSILFLQSCYYLQTQQYRMEDLHFYICNHYLAIIV